ncbi:G-D-S-L family lipolytic protein [Croceiramulus getboli]|nr:SGNH/GDSL hydrolase family protein [Flavobacteriaceae bacterium YJPT1-3]
MITTKFKWLIPIALLAVFTACESDDDTTTETEVEVALTSGDADFSNYVAVGNSLTAGFTDGALFLAAQQNSMPSIMASKFALAGGGEFTQPLYNDNIGGLTLQGTVIAEPRLFFNGAGPQRLPATPQTDIVPGLSGPFNNMGVPGAKSFHLLANGYGNVQGVLTGQANPYFVRFASSPNASVIEDAVSQNPTFFSLWIGNNDVLGYATTGGDGSNPITDAGLFTQAYQGAVTALTANGAQGVVANIPDVTTIPFFTTIPVDALNIDAATAANLTGFFQAVSGVFAGGLIAQGVPPAQAQALAAQYAITFEEGPNNFLIDVAPSQTNPLGFRQATDEELLVLTIDQGALAQGYGSVVLTPEVFQILGLLQAGGTPTPAQANTLFGAVSGIDDKDVLDMSEIAEVKAATDNFNSIIKSTADQAGLAFVDANALLSQIASGGIDFDEFTLQGNLVFGGAFSLDGVHPTARGYAFLANQFLMAIDATYGSNFEASGNLAAAADYNTIYSAMLP